jgi:SNF5 / SMARCB1 / INI1
MSSSSNLPTRPSISPRVASALIPIRVDVVSDDKTIRIVDTLLLDPTCWPIPLYDPLEESVEVNISDLAHSILSDAEVQSMGRTVRHFTGRLDLWTVRLQEKVEEQLRPQLWKIATGRVNLPNHGTGPVHISIRLMVQRIVIHEDILWDPNGPTSVIDFAQDMAGELNLPDEAVVAIATTMSEQLYGLPMDATSDPSAVVNSITRPLRGAWTMDAKEHNATASQVVAQHRTV